MTRRGGTETVDGAQFFRERLSEADFMAQVAAEARMRGWRVYHTRDSRGSAAGFPDLVMVRRGRLVFAELKSMKGKERPEQAQWLHELRAVERNVAGFSSYAAMIVAAHLWRPSDWPAIEVVLR